MKQTQFGPSALCFGKGIEPAHGNLHADDIFIQTLRIIGHTDELKVQRLISFAALNNMFTCSEENSEPHLIVRIEYFISVLPCHPTIYLNFNVHRRTLNNL